MALLAVSTTGIVAAPTNPFSLIDEDQPKCVEVNNCVLVKINGKPITMLDIVKKMDMFFHRQFAQYSDIAAARYEFYQMSWPRFLKDMIDKELILADAEECKVQVTAGDIRQEMETLFGPHIIPRLEEIGIAYEDALNIVKGDLLLRRMLYIKVQMKALQEITPQVVRQAYERYALKGHHPEQWRYYVLSFRAPQAAGCQAAAKQAHQLLTEQMLPLDKLVDTLKMQKDTADVTVTVSEEFCLPRAEVSELYRTVLETLAPDSYSEPLVQKSRATNSSLYRIFYLKALEPEGCASFTEVEMRIRQELMEAVVERETTAYLERLRRHFSIQTFCDPAAMPSGYQPFVLR